MQKRLIGLTGGIATGKSTVANYLAESYNLPILDSDIYAREAVAVGSAILKKINQKYGDDILLPDNSLNRQKLGEIVFESQIERLWIESLIHPYVRDRFNQEMAKISSDTLVLVIPLLFEVGLTNLVTETWVVSCSQEQQLKRLMQRNNLTLEQAQARINSQMPLSEKVKLADVVFDNSQSVEMLLKLVNIVMDKTKL
ncbi:dephospho-CoA kinase [Brunnivagina elsteri]|uniref:Dephospho-CoA kinase n=1 Tax=Brunnivagina elsteri CCALA 953 TaxID=987040 RepID=A0A2A2TP36_9CYAN|nr:dephospho-CoA kinase [Calothrix elsteri]PAX60249.1 dephospho-CoA kinase [Calothrix elsteri CCALA 953]